MQVLWWLVPPLVATCLAMVWVGVARARPRRRSAATTPTRPWLRMQKALAQADSEQGRDLSRPSRPSRAHGVAIRGAARRPGAGSDEPPVRRS